MIAVGGSLLALLLIIALLCLVGVVVTVLPFVTTVDLAERRGFSPERWGAVTLVAIGLAVGIGYAARTHGLLLLVPAALVPWSVAALLALLAPLQTRIGGRLGLHE